MKFPLKTLVPVMPLASAVHTSADDVVRIVLDLGGEDARTTRGHFSRLLSAVLWQDLRARALPDVDNDSAGTWSDAESSSEESCSESHSAGDS